MLWGLDGRPCYEDRMSDQTPDATGPSAEASDDIPDDIPGETPVQRALRLKQARLEARPQPPRGGRFQREQAARVATGAARPGMQK